MVALNLSNILAANNTTFLSSSNYTATAGQVKFVANYTVGYVEVYQNGLRLADSDFTAANGEHVILASGASVNDNIDIIAHQAANLVVLGAALPTTNMIAGTGLTGGGTLAGDRTFNVTNPLGTNISTANLTMSGTFLATASSAKFTPSSGDVDVRIVNKANTATGRLFFGDNNSETDGALIYYHGASAMAFQVNAAERVRITSAGYVGVGTASPTSDLHVYTSGTTQAKLGLSTSGHYFGAQSDDSTDAFEIYQQHGSNATRQSFIVNDNRTGSKSAAFAVRGDGLAQFGGDITADETIVVKKGVPVRTAGGNNVTLALTDNGKLIYCVNTASAMNIHIPNNSSVAFPVGAEMSFLQHLTHASANTLGFSNAAGVILHSKEAANTVADRFTTAVLKKLATNTWVLAGSLS